MAEEVAKLERDNTMVATAKEGEAFLEAKGQVDEDAKTRAQQKEIEEITSTEEQSRLFQSLFYYISVLPVWATTLENMQITSVAERARGVRYLHLATKNSFGAALHEFEKSNLDKRRKGKFPAAGRHQEGWGASPPVRTAWYVSANQAENIKFFEGEALGSILAPGQINSVRPGAVKPGIDDFSKTNLDTNKATDSA
ncbi:Hypothetical predicted protein, partial [Paramuricea clavata]